MKNELLENPQHSDDIAAVGARGQGDTTCILLNMTTRLADKSDAAYIRWHTLDHFAEQYRIVGFRGGQRWVSTPDCRSARAASNQGFDEVDHVMAYLFGEPLDSAMDDFAELGHDLNAVGRMPRSTFGADPSMTISRQRHIGTYDVVNKISSREALVGAAVIPWRPARGVYVLLERTPQGNERGQMLDDLAETPGVAGMWRYRGSDEHRPDRFGRHSDLALAVYYLDEEPSAVGEVLGSALAGRWADESISPLLAAPFEVVVPWQWDRALPH